MISFKYPAKTTAEHGKARPKKHRPCFLKQMKIIPFKIAQKDFISKVNKIVIFSIFQTSVLIPFYIKPES